MYKVTVVETSSTLLGEGASVHIIQEGEHRVDQAAQTPQAAQAQAAKNEIAKLQQAALKDVATNGGKDHHACPHYDNPGQDELSASLDSVTKDWRDINPTMLERVYIVTGKPPSTVTTEFYDQILIPSAKMFDRSIPSLRPVVWLEKQMPLLKVDEQLQKDLGFRLGRVAFGRTEEEMWFRVVAHYNGFVKTLVELFEYVPKQPAKKQSKKRPNIVVQEQSADEKKPTQNKGSRKKKRTSKE